MALVTSSSPNSKLNPSPLLSFTPLKKLSSSSTRLKCNLPISKFSLSKRLSSKDQNFIANYGVLANTCRERTKKTRLSASIGDASIVQEPNSHRIWLSDVVVKRANNVFLGRKWNSLDVATLSMVVLMHGLALFAPFYFNWGPFWMALLLYLTTGLLGICLSFHRNLSHRSFKLPKWLEYFCAYCGVLALQGNPIDWVSTHRYHHQYCDSEQDPHSPLEGFWFSHMNWLFDTRAIVERGLRTIWVYHITWFVNSACHVWGNQAWDTGDLSRNNWWVALLSFGEGWHNNHHAFEYSARHGLEWWQVDVTWYTVKLLQVIGLAKDVKLPIEAHKQRLAFKRDGVTA